MVESITHQEVLQQKILIPCESLSKDMNTLVEQKLQDTVGNICLESGFIQKDSIEIIRRSLGMYDAEKLRGEFAYIVEYKADIVLPTEGCQLTGDIISKNKMGLLMTIGENNELRVLLPKDYHTDNEEFDKKKVGEKLTCTIVASDFSLGSKFINCIGMMI